MQTISLPYRCPDKDRAFLDECRRVYSAAIRTAYANAHDADGKPLKQKPLRDLVKARFKGGRLDAWALNCGTLKGMDTCASGYPTAAWFSAGARCWSGAARN